ncbi:protein mono-ADP-ribosyltransferase PARP15 [Xenopus laevis]|nr:protein mono-ADP-ribosyltransferase PARP15 [Xenopus laevis]
MVPALEKILEECGKHSIKTVALPAIGTGNAGIDLNESVSRTIEGLIQHFEKVALTSLTKICIVAFKDKVYQAYSQAFKNIQQSDPYSEDNEEEMPNNPSTWTDMGTDEFQTVELSRDSIEFKDVENKFLESIHTSNFKVIKIKRVQNVKLWRSYCVRQASVRMRLQYEKNERLLFHGTCLEFIPQIIQYGFNRSYSGRNGLAYGRGTYFALNASYSCCDTYSARDKDGNKHVILAAVITGTWRKGKRNYIDAPPTKEDPETRCDCVVDNVNNPTVFVIFCDDGAYPKYIITFK